MKIPIINPKNSCPLQFGDGKLFDLEGYTCPVIGGVARITKLDNYANNFGLQWNKFDKTQLDRESDGLTLSRERFFASTRWDPNELVGCDILEVGSGAGRFSRVVLEYTHANLYSVDYSDAVVVNFNNNSKIAPKRFHIYQADIYELPFPDKAFDKVFCFGVLQHTPNFHSSVKALISKVKPGGELVVDFYPINGWWTKVHAKYLFRTLIKDMSHESLFKLIDSNVNWLIWLSNFLNKIGCGALTRFLPLVDLRTLPKLGLSKLQFREWVVLDTFDMFSPVHDHPQRVKDVAAMFDRNGVEVTFAGYVEFGDGFKSAVVRGNRRS